MTKTKRDEISNAKQMVGASVFHAGEHGVVERYCPEYQPATTIVAVRFGGRVAMLKPAEIGAR